MLSDTRYCLLVDITKLLLDREISGGREEDVMNERRNLSLSLESSTYFNALSLISRRRSFGSRNSVDRLSIGINISYPSVVLVVKSLDEEGRPERIMLIESPILARLRPIELMDSCALLTVLLIEASFLAPAGRTDSAAKLRSKSVSVETLRIERKSIA